MGPEDGPRLLGEAGLALTELLGAKQNGLRAVLAAPFRAAGLAERAAFLAAGLRVVFLALAMFGSPSLEEREFPLRSKRD